MREEQRFPARRPVSLKDVHTQSFILVWPCTRLNGPITTHEDIDVLVAKATHQHLCLSVEFLVPSATVLKVVKKCDVRFMK